MTIFSRINALIDTSVKNGEARHRQIAAQNETMIQLLTKFTVQQVELNKKIEVFLSREQTVLDAMEKFFKIQVELTNKQIESIETLQPTEHDLRF